MSEARAPMSISLAPIKDDKSDKEGMNFMTYKHIDRDDNQTQFKVTIPIFNNGTHEQFLNLCYIFERNAEILGWTNTNKKVRAFTAHLQNESLANWIRITDDADMDDEDNFNLCLSQLLEERFDKRAFSDQRAYLLNVKKSRSINVATFLSRIRTLNLLMSKLPNESEELVLTEDQIKTIFYLGMPFAWREIYELTDVDYRDKTISQLLFYMKKREEASNKGNNNNNGNNKNNSRNNQNKNNGNNNNRNGNGQNENNNSGRRNNSQNKGKNNNGNNSNNKTNRNNGDNNNKKNDNNSTRLDQAKDEDPCRLHGGHKWKDCFFNPKGVNYKPFPFGQQGQQRQTYYNQHQPPMQQQPMQHSNGQFMSPQTSQPHSMMYQSGYQQQQPVQQQPWCQPTNQGTNFYYEQQSSHPMDDFRSESYFFDAETEFEPDSYEVHYVETEVQSSTDSVLTTTTNVTTEIATVPEEIIDIDLVPSTIITIHSIGGKISKTTGIALLDSGGSHVMVKRSALPKTGFATVGSAPASFTTTAGVLCSQEYVKLETIHLPEFSRVRSFGFQNAYIFDDKDNKIPYDFIIGRDFLRNAGIDIKFSKQVSTWLGIDVPMHPHGFWTDQARLRDLLYCEPIRVTDDYERHQSYLSTPSTAIVNSDYHRVDVEQVAQSQCHLSQSQRNDLASLFHKHTKLFSGELRTYPKKVYSLELREDAVPHHSKAYSIPYAHQSVFKTELDRLANIGVITKTGASEWAAGTFIIPKKDGRVRWITDFRHLNKYIKRKTYPLPNPQDILALTKPYQFLSKLDLSMQYYTFELDAKSQDLCTFVTPFGTYKYTKLPMGVCQSGDWSQEAMDEMLSDFDQGELSRYIDDLKTQHMTWEEHLRVLEIILTRLEVNGFTVNPAKCDWGVSETDYLGYWITPTGFKPWRKKVDAILALEPPTNRSEIRSWLGCITFYRNCWPQRAHILAPITALTSTNVPFIWGEEQANAFKMMNSLIAEDILLTFPDFNAPFYLHTDASNYQLGSRIAQYDKPVAFYSRKLTKTQMNYTTIEKELLSVVETLQEFRSMLFGAEIHIYTDHQNLLSDQPHVNERVRRWKILIDTFQPIFHYVKGDTNIEADSMSRHPTSNLGSTAAQAGPLETDLGSVYGEIFLNHPPILNTNDPIYPLDYELIAEHQANDMSLQDLHLQQSLQYPKKDFGLNLHLICHIPNRNTAWKICIPETLKLPIIHWYHISLGHPGIQRLYQTIATHFHSVRLRDNVEHYIRNCDACQRYKLPGPGRGELPPRLANSIPWNDVSVDLIGPWSINIPGHGIIIFHALTSIDIVTTLAEITRIDNKMSQHIANCFENSYLARYPRPLRCIHDNGGEFIGAPFQHMLTVNGIKDVPTTVKNPQANAICERLHQTISNVLRTLIYAHPPTNEHDANAIIDTALSTTMYASRATIHSAMKLSPGAMSFHRDMILPIPIHADFALLRQKRQVVIDDNLRRQNLLRISHDYQVGNEVLIIHSNTEPGNRLASPTEGPFVIQQVHTNGTVTILRSANIYERINIRRLRRYHRL